MIYLDHNATSPLHPAARAAMVEALDQPGHPGSRHRPGRRTRALVESARATVADALGARPSQVHFTAGGTAANVSAIGELVLASQCPTLLIAATEHPSVHLTVDRWVRAGLAHATTLPVLPDGQPDLPLLARLLPEADALVLMAANNETGTQPDLDAVGALVQGAGVAWHCDAVQAAREGWRAHAAMTSVAIAGHKLGGPRGTGALITDRALPFPSGTPPVAALAGLAAAVSALGPASPAARDRLERALLAAFPGSVVHGSRRLANTCCISLRVPGGWVDGVEVAAELALREVAVSNGAACVTGTASPSHVLTAMGVCAEQAHAALRFSLGPSTPHDVAEQVVPLLRAAVASAQDA